MHRIATYRFPPETFGPMPEFQFRGPEGLNLFLSAVGAPRWRYFRTVHEKAAALFRSLTKNHALVDGNKRLAVVSLDVFLIVNRVDFRVSQENKIAAAIAVAEFQGNFPVDVIARWIRGGCVGRPRNLVRELADTWPAARQYYKAAARAADIGSRRGVRVPGHRVRVGPEFWELVQREMRSDEEHRRG